ncbi:hypothetical protein PR048_011925 [Dryococelus australis]|uniref:Uncharacterized protein n=1 Tax=Dryococelus australis TaxID=614101 RepID=A0ABQ9HNA7_9NEOP|nr:hypothetical protein PR048_011925 [Dryococelus australis]
MMRMVNGLNAAGFWKGLSSESSVSTCDGVSRNHLRALSASLTLPRPTSQGGLSGTLQMAKKLVTEQMVQSAATIFQCATKPITYTTSTPKETWMGPAADSVPRCWGMEISATSTGMKGWRKREISEKIRRPVASSGTIATCENPGVTRLGISGPATHGKCRRTRTRFDPRRCLSQISACGNRAGRCRWLADFLGDFPLPLPFHSGAAPYSPRFSLIDSQDLDVNSRPNFFAHSLTETVQMSYTER